MMVRLLIYSISSMSNFLQHFFRHRDRMLDKFKRQRMKYIAILADKLGKFGIKTAFKAI